jgi:hypothetical protein
MSRNYAAISGTPMAPLKSWLLRKLYQDQESQPILRFFGKAGQLRQRIRGERGLAFETFCEREPLFPGSGIS